MIQLHLRHKLILDTEIFDLANYKTIQTRFVVVLDLFRAEKNIAV